jgi:hypothetical protein
LKCQCAAQPPSQNSCGGLPSFAVVISTPFCQKYCNLIHGENRRQGSVLLTSPRSCGCVALTDLYCDDLCRETQSREGSVGNGKRCECTNLPTRLANLRRRCTNVCGWHHMSWTGSTSGQLCVCA